MTERLNKLQQMIPSLDCEALLVSDPISIEYLTGLRMSAGKLIVYPKSAVLGVDGRYIEEARQKKLCETILYALDKGPISLLGHSVHSLGFISDQVSYKEFLELQQLCIDRAIVLVPVENPVKKLRSIKSAEEIHKLIKASELGSEGYDFVVSQLREGITESELAFELEFFWKKRGAEDLAFEPIIAFGPNSSKPHYRAGQTRLQKGDTVLIDIGVVLDGYHSDMTRVVFFGEPPPKMKEIYTIVQKAQAAALVLCKPGIAIEELDDAARNLIKQHGYGDAFSHSLGHGIGMETHEFPIIRRSVHSKNILLEPGMAITIEPGIYLPGIGGVRLEDLIVITPEGYQNLTNRPFEKL